MLVRFSSASLKRIGLKRVPIQNATYVAKDVHDEKLRLGKLCTENDVYSVLFELLKNA